MADGVTQIMLSARRLTEQVRDLARAEGDSASAQSAQAVVDSYAVMLQERARNVYCNDVTGLGTAA